VAVRCKGKSQETGIERYLIEIENISLKNGAKENPKKRELKVLLKRQVAHSAFTRVQRKIPRNGN